jgi:hypothetical protein
MIVDGLIDQPMVDLSNTGLNQRTDPMSDRSMDQWIDRMID